MLTFINVDAATVQTENEMWKPFKGEETKEVFLNYMNTVFSLSEENFFFSSEKNPIT